MHPENKQGKFLDGFFWGAVIGGGFACLLSTKRGRDFLKDLIDEGIDILEDFSTPESEEVSSETFMVIKEEGQNVPATQDVVQKEPPKVDKRSRFFRREKKK